MSLVLVVNHRLGAGLISNPDGTVPADVSGCSVVAGPGATSVGALSEALHFDGSARVTATPDAALFDARAFCLHVIFRVTAPVTDRMNLFEGGRHGCSLYVDVSDGIGQFRIVATVDNARNGWAGTETFNRQKLQLNTWYEVNVAFQLDTLGLFAGWYLVSSTAFPDGQPSSRDTAEFVVGIHPDLERWPFIGDIALVQLWSDVPEPIASALDDARASPEWHIRLKENTLLPDLDLGPRNGDITADAASGMSLQRFPDATIGYGNGFPSAHMMRGPIRERWERAVLGPLLGVLISDEEAVGKPGATRNVFEKGMIYWSEETGAWEIVGRPAIDYELLGGSTSVLGLPLAAPESIPGGTMQRFASGRLYFEDGTGSAHEVHGAILQHYLDRGGPDTFGFPISDEQDVNEALTDLLLPRPTGAKMSRFTMLGSVIIWGPETGAHDVRESLARAYFNSGGPGLPFDDRFNGLGLPIGDHTHLPGSPNSGWFTLFEHGSVVRHGGRTRVCPAFQIRLVSVQTEEDEGIGQGQNDLYFKITLSLNGTPVWNKRVPDSGAFEGSNTHDLDLLLDPVFTPNDASLSVRVHVEVWDEDDFLGGGDDHLGTLDTELNLSNCWGLLDDPSGYQVAGGLDKVLRFEWSVVPRWLPNAPKDFFEETNQGTPHLTLAQYAAAFSDVDDDPEWTDPADWANREVFARRVKRCAAKGNCFGFCTEALYAWHGLGVGLPLRRFAKGSWPLIRNAINIKHIYQMGSDNITARHKQNDDNIGPIQVFQRTRELAERGIPSIINIFSETGLKGDGHAVLPLPSGWDDSTSPWTIRCFDPNTGNSPGTLFVNPDNTFSYSNNLDLNRSIYFSSWSSLDHRQASPAWDPNLLLLSLLMVAVGADAETVSLSDTSGANLLMSANPRRERLAMRGQFSEICTVDGEIDGEILLRTVLPTTTAVPFGAGDPYEPTIGDLLKHLGQSAALQSPVGHIANNLPKALKRSLAAMTTTAELSALKVRDIIHQVGGAAALARQHPELAALGQLVSKQNSQKGPDFVHQLKGTRSGKFEYQLRWRLTNTMFSAPIGMNETHTVEAKGLVSGQQVHRLTCERDKLVTVQHTIRLGRTADFARVTVADLPCTASAPVTLAIRPGLASIDILSAASRTEVPVTIETWRGELRRQAKFMTTMEGGMRLSALLREPGEPLWQSSIETLFGSAKSTMLLNSVN